MKITFPYMGPSHVAFKALLSGVGNEVIVPPKPSKLTLDLGTKYAPEFACLPFKILLGSYIQALEMGADTILSSGGIGPCRAGYYTQMQKKILQDMGYKFEMITLEPPKGHMKDFIHSVKKVVHVKWKPFWHAFKISWIKLMALDDMERLSHELRPLEKIRGSATALLEESIAAIDAAQTPDEIKEAAGYYSDRFKGMELDHSRNPIKVGIIGEIYVVLEPFANHNIIETLGNMGVYAHRSIFLTNWAKENTLLDALRVKPEKNIRMQAKPYLNEPVGGHGENSVGETVIYAKKGFDGVIQLAPFTCIPEIVAKSIIPRVSKDYNIPVLTVTLDEQTGTEGLNTRLEAFVDLLERKRRIMEDKVV